MACPILFQNILYRPVQAENGAERLLLSDGTALCLPPEALAAEVRRRGIPPRCDFIDCAGTAEYRREMGIAPPHMLVSACLAGERCRYDGSGSLRAPVRDLVSRGGAVPVCPECAGGLPCPRPPCERRGDAVAGRGGGDYTAAFRTGAEKCLEALAYFPIREALLKARSPSCGTDRIYDGTFSGRLIPGAGIFAEMLSAKGIRLSNEENNNLTALERST